MKTDGKEKRPHERGNDRYEFLKARFHSIGGIKVPKTKKERYAIARKIKSLRNIK